MGGDVGGGGGGGDVGVVKCLVIVMGHCVTFKVSIFAYQLANLCVDTSIFQGFS